MISKIKTIKTLQSLYSMKVLGLAFVPGMAARITGGVNMFLNGIDGVHYTNKHLNVARKNYAMNNKEWHAFVNYVDPFQAGLTWRKAKDLSMKASNKVLDLDNWYFPLRSPDENIDGMITVAMAQNHGIDKEGVLQRLVDLPQGTPSLWDSFTKKFLTGLNYFIYRKGPLTVGASYLCGFIKSDSYLENPNLQFHISPASTDLLGKAELHKFPAFTPTITNVRPTSRGTIEIKSSDTRIYPKIKMNYLSTYEDREIAAKSIKIVRKIVLESKAYNKYQPKEYRPGIEFKDNESLAREAGKFANTIFHPVSTCRMGNDYYYIWKY